MMDSVGGWASKIQYPQRLKRRLTAIIKEMAKLMELNQVCDIVTEAM